MTNGESYFYGRKGIQHLYRSSIIIEVTTVIPTNRKSTHPGEILLEEFLKPMGISQVAFAEHHGIPIQRINEIVKGKRGITPETAWLFSQALKTSPEFW